MSQFRNDTKVQSSDPHGVLDDLIGDINKLNAMIGDTFTPPNSGHVP